LPGGKKSRGPRRATVGIKSHKVGSASPPALKEAWAVLVAIPEAEGKAFVSNKVAASASEFLKAHGLSWNGYSKKKIPGM
jgi:hypothetical protein